MGHERCGSADAEGAAALSRLEEALELLDRSGAPGDIGAHVDLAVQRLKAALRQAELDEAAGAPGRAAVS